MFSTGQLIFALFFVISFTCIIVIMYRKDAQKHLIHYKGSYKILISFVLGLLALFLIKFFLH